MAYRARRITITNQDGEIILDRSSNELIQLNLFSCDGGLINVLYSHEEIINFLQNIISKPRLEPRKEIIEEFIKLHSAQ